MIAETIVAAWLIAVYAVLLRRWRNGALAREPVRIADERTARRYHRVRTDL